MNTTKLISKKLLILPILLFQSAFSKEAEAKKYDDILEKGMTWHYNVTLVTPEGGVFKPEFDKKGEISKQGTVYKFKETQQSTGKHQIEDLDAKVTRVNIYIDDTLRKQQLLEFTDESLLYYGTYNIDLTDLGKKAGYVTRAPIVLYTNKAEVAQKWAWKHDKIPSFQFRVIAKDTDIKVVAGTFKADKIRMEQIDNSSGKVIVAKEIWFVKGVGVVKEIEKQYVMGGKAITKTLELTKYGTEDLRPEPVAPAPKAASEEETTEEEATEK